jgi:hypothetical protein
LNPRTTWIFKIAGVVLASPLDVYSRRDCVLIQIRASERSLGSGDFALPAIRPSGISSD